MLPGRVSCLLSVDQLAECTIEQEQLIVFTSKIGEQTTAMAFPSNKEVRKENKQKQRAIIRSSAMYVVSLRSSLVDDSIFHMDTTGFSISFFLFC